MKIISVNSEDKVMVTCINNEFNEDSLTLNKDYKVIYISDTHYTVIDDNGVPVSCNRGRFIRK